MKNEMSNEVISKKKFWRDQRIENAKEYRKQTRLEVRLSNAELNYIECISNKLGWTKSDYVLSSCLYGEIKKVDFTPLIKLQSELNHIGNNLNQMTRQLNVACKEQNLSDDLVRELLREIEELKRVNEEWYAGSNSLKMKAFRFLKRRRYMKFDEDIDGAFDELDGVQDEHGTGSMLVGED